ncbi:MAG: hypothetical protein C0594_02715 [Marinilabiliales bacterium]|nr:MAG: hypothetical protein C0594_02715 [Marinilabiliales bacterium]
MGIHAGDKVRFLNDVGGGMVVKEVDKQTVLVRNDFGFDVPVLRNELVVIEKGGVDNLVDIEQETKPKEEKVAFGYDDEEFDTYFELPDNLSDEQEIAPVLYFALVPKEDKNLLETDIQLYLINDSDCELTYHYNLKTNDRYLFREKGELEDNTKVYLETFHRQDITSIAGFYLQALVRFKNTDYMLDNVQSEVQIPHIKLFKETSFVENDYFDEPAMFLSVDLQDSLKKLENIDSEQIKKEIQKKEESVIDEKQKNFKSPKPNKEIVEVDLHIYNLTEEDYRQLSNSEMLEIQMNHFRDTLNNSLQNKDIYKLVFIHGVGNGTLKNEIRRTLDREYSYIKYQDASFKEYGYGATLLILR